MKISRLLIICLVASMNFSLFAKPNKTVKPEDCPPEEKGKVGAQIEDVLKVNAKLENIGVDERLLRIFCDEVREKVKLPSTDNTDYLYRWEITLLRLAGTKPEDPEEVRVQKVRNWWNQNNPDLRCSADTFSILNKPHIMFYGFNLLNEDFMMFMVGDYEIDLNVISHDQTLLDYIQSEIKRYPPLEETYQKYYRFFRNNGAKHKHEL